MPATPTGWSLYRKYVNDLNELAVTYHDHLVLLN